MSMFTLDIMYEVKAWERLCGLFPNKAMWGALIWEK